MGLIDQANKDIQQITSNANEFGVKIKLVAPNGQVANIVGIHPKVHLGVGTEGNVISTRQARVTFSEQVLINANPNYPIRNADEKIDLLKHIITVADSTGNDHDYVAQEWIPDETIGLIVIMLGDYGQNN